jgi:UDP-galactopyranose mutase
LSDRSSREAFSATAPITFVTDAKALQAVPIVCFSHLRWDFVFQRPQHLLSRFAKERPVYVFEEPIWSETQEPARLDLRTCEKSGVVVAQPHLPWALYGSETDTLRSLLDGMIKARRLRRPVAWYYTPMMVPFSRHLETSAVVYDCMDELSQFRFAPPTLVALETELLGRADVVFTGGFSIYEYKKDQHANVHAFPSSVDKAHFGQARNLSEGDLPDDLTSIPQPRLGYYGVVDERLDYDLIAALADARPDWSIVMVGPLAKVSQEDLPSRPNIHWLGGRSYAELPTYLAGWDVALMPFALNEATRFISPTKTPEYLSGGRPVVSTRITDVERSYGKLEAVGIADTAEQFVAACERAMALPRTGPWLEAVDEALKDLSWDATQGRMSALLDKAIARRRAAEMRPSAPAVLPSNRRPHYDALIVGAGFAGSVLAERLAADADKRVLVIDKRPHIAGNAYDHFDAAGVLIHKYGPHIFHTNSDEIAAYLSRFTKWRAYEHRVLADVGEQLVPMPINRTTLNKLFGLTLKTDAEAAGYLASRAEPVAKIERPRTW